MQIDNNKRPRFPGKIEESTNVSMQELTSSNFQGIFFNVMNTSEALMAFATYFRHLKCFNLNSYAT
jgi:hypothetical protein